MKLSTIFFAAAAFYVLKGLSIGKSFGLGGDGDELWTDEAATNPTTFAGWVRNSFPDPITNKAQAMMFLARVMRGSMQIKDKQAFSFKPWDAAVTTAKFKLVQALAKGDVAEAENLRLELINSPTGFTITKVNAAAAQARPGLKAAGYDTSTAGRQGPRGDRGEAGPSGARPVSKIPLFRVPQRGSGVKLRKHNDFSASKPYDPGFSPVNWQKNVGTAASYDAAHQTSGVYSTNGAKPQSAFDKALSTAIKNMPTVTTDTRNNLPSYTPPPSYSSGGNDPSWSLKGLGDMGDFLEEMGLE